MPDNADMQVAFDILTDDCDDAHLQFWALNLVEMGVGTLYLMVAHYDPRVLRQSKSSCALCPTFASRSSSVDGPELAHLTTRSRSGCSTGSQAVTGLIDAVVMHLERKGLLT